MAKFHFYLPEQICLRAVDGDLDLIAAAEEFWEVAAAREDYLAFACPGHEVLLELFDALQKAPGQRAQIEARYGERVMAFFLQMLDGYTTLDSPRAEPKCYPLVRSAPDQIS